MDVSASAIPVSPIQNFENPSVRDTIVAQDVKLATFYDVIYFLKKAFENMNLTSFKYK